MCTYMHSGLGSKTNILIIICITALLKLECSVNPRVLSLFALVIELYGFSNAGVSTATAPMRGKYAAELK